MATGLDERGDISIAIICIYLPIFFLALLLTLRHGFSRQAGWVSLLIFTIFRIVGGALHIAAEKTSPPSIGLFSAAFAIESAGVAALLLCTLGFIGIIGTHATTYLFFVQPTIMRVIRLVLTVAVILAIVGATDTASSSKSTQKTGSTLRKVGSLVILAVLAVCTVFHFMLWGSKQYILMHRRTLLLGISCALPFLFVRVVYSVLSAFSPTVQFNSNGSITSSTSGLANFNSISGEWQIYLGMAIIMELVVIGVYIGFGITLPISKEDDQYKETQQGNVDYESNTGYAHGGYAQGGQGQNGYEGGYTGRNNGNYAMGRR